MGEIKANNTNNLRSPVAGVHREPGASLFSLRSPETRKKKKRRDVNEMIRLPHSVRRQRVRMPSHKRMDKYIENERGRERETLPFSLSIRRSDSGEKEGKRKKETSAEPITSSSSSCWIV